MAKVRMVGSIDADAATDFEGMPCIILTADSFEELRRIGGMLYEDVDVVLTTPAPPPVKP